MLFAAPYEELLGEPLGEVRRRLGIAENTLAHPTGHIYSAFQFGSARTRAMDVAFEPYRYEPDRSLS